MKTKSTTPRQRMRRPKPRKPTPARPQRTLDRGDPMKSARIMMADYFIEGGLQTLWRHRDEFWWWNGSYYEVANAGTLRAHIWQFLERSLRIEAKTGATIPFKPTPQLVSAVADALSSVCILHDRIEPPVWISSGTNKPAPIELFACANGLLHLPTGKLYPATPDFFCLNASRVKYDRRAKAPRWDKFLRTLFGTDRQPVRLLQHWFGYVVSPDMAQQKILGIIGPPRSGKGTIARLLRALLGTTSVAGPTMHSIGTEFGLEPLITKPLAVISDVRIGKHTSVSTIVERTLSISGEDVLTVPRKHTKAWHGQLPTRIMFLTNEPLALTDSAGAFTSRLMMLNLTETFLGREDMELTPKLKREASGILNWAIAGYRSLKAEGHFTQPKSSYESIARMERLGSPIKAFIADRCEVKAGATVLVDLLYEQWLAWCREDGRKDSGTKEWFGRNLHAALPKLKLVKRGPDNERKRCYQGLMLIERTKAEEIADRLANV
jgi:putative DNA primase/helicase